MQHPAHVHVFRHTIRELEEAGHDVSVVVREKDVMIDLLEGYDISYECLTGPPSGALGLLQTQARYELGIIRRTLERRPDVLLAVGEPSVAHAAQLVGGTSVLLTDTESATFSNALAFPFADVICTPECYFDDLGDEQVTYPGYQELAYLHPDRFSPDPTVFDDLDVDPEDTIAFVRSISWEAVHDIGQSGVDDVSAVVETLEAEGASVLLSSQENIPPELSDYVVDIDPCDIHHVLYYSDLFIGEGATMAAESAVLGTPAIYVSTIRHGYIDELERDYGLVFMYSDDDRQRQALDKAVEILGEQDPEMFADRRERLLVEKRDTTDVVLSMVHRAAGSSHETEQRAAPRKPSTASERHTE